MNLTKQDVNTRFAAVLAQHRARPDVPAFLDRRYAMLLSAARLSLSKGVR